MSSAVPKQLRLLVVEDSEDDYANLLRALDRAGYDVVAARVTTEPELAASFDRGWDVLVTDWVLASFGGHAAIVLAADHDVPCVVISALANEQTAVDALRAGALDFVSKDRAVQFVPSIERALREATERRGRVAAQRELRLSEERYRLGFMVAPEALLTYDLANSKILDANPAALKLFGYSLAELRAMAIGGLSAPRQADGRTSVEAARELIARAAAIGETPTFEWIYQDRNGQPLPTTAHHAKLPAAAAEISLVTIIDQRERIRSDEIRRHSTELELQNRRIQEANRLKSEFLANMSHELRTPLNAIIGFAELLHDGQVDPASPQHGEFLRDILTSGRHLLQLINDVLDLAKVEAGALDFRPEPVDLGRLLNEVVTITRTTAAAKRITVAIELDPALGSVVIDPSRFKQVAYNYLSNALKFTPDAGRVVIRIVAEPPDRFRLEVEDTGVGIATADLSRLFIEFQQLEAGAAKRHQGTGLGLALTRRLVEAQGGTVGVRSTPGKGSVFHATLKLHTVVGDAVVLPQTKVSACTILIVEHDQRDRDVLVTVLAEAGYAVEIAHTGAEAIARCRDRVYDAITLDLLLPDMNGLDLLGALRTDGRATKTPVIVVTVVPDAHIVAGFAVHDVLHKPLDRDALLAAIDRAGVRPDRSGGILVVDDDPGALRLMDATLAQLGFDVITRSSGAAGLVAAEQLTPSAVVLDLIMPEMDGFEFLDRFRRIYAHARTPVLIWTMKDLTGAEHARLRGSAQAVVSKHGSSPSTVVAQLRALLPAPGAR